MEMVYFAGLEAIPAYPGLARGVATKNFIRILLPQMEYLGLKGISDMHPA
jgi:hypothetical protein